MSNFYTKETLTQALDWLAARRDMATGTVIDQYVAQLPTVAHGVPSWEAIDKIVTDADPDREHFGITRQEQNKIVNAIHTLLTSHRAPSESQNGFTADQMELMWGHGRRMMHLHEAWETIEHAELFGKTAPSDDGVREAVDRINEALRLEWSETEIDALKAAWLAKLELEKALATLTKEKS